MSFADELGRFALAVRNRSQAVFVNSASAVKDSITDGSPITTAPGQPVDTGALKASWVLEFPEPDLAEVSTNLVYAPAIEDGEGQHGPLTLRSKVGGFHSVKLTALNFDRLVEAEVAKAAG